MRSAARRLCEDAALIALALVLSWLEKPIVAALPLPLPGFKLGFANIVTLFALYRIGAADAAVVLALRIALAAVLFGTPVSFALSACGGALAFLTALLLYKRTYLSIYGVSVASAAAHMCGQTAAAAVILSTPELIITYLPYLLLLSVFSGLLNGFISRQMINKVRIKKWI